MMKVNQYALITNQSELIGAIEQTEKLAVEIGFDEKDALLLKLVVEESCSNMVRNF